MSLPFHGSVTEEEFLADVELKRQATNLDFTTLADASCSNPDDEVRIRAAIAGFEHEVEIAIQNLCCITRKGAICLKRHVVCFLFFRGWL